MAGVCVELDAKSVADQCILLTPSKQEDGVHNFLEGLEEVLKDSGSTYRLGSWLNGLIKEYPQEGASVFAYVPPPLSTLTQVL